MNSNGWLISFEINIKGVNFLITTVKYSTIFQYKMTWLTRYRRNDSQVFSKEEKKKKKEMTLTSALHQEKFYHGKILTYIDNTICY